MNETNLIWLVVGAGIGCVVSLGMFRSSKRSPSNGTLQSSQADLSLLQEKLHQMELAYGMAVQMSQYKGRFLARTSHELRSPLNGLIGMHQLILADLCDNPEEERTFIGQANESALKMVKVLDEVIDAAKVEHGTNQLELHPVPLQPLFANVYNLTHLQAQNRNLQLTIQSPSANEFVQADLRRLQQVLISLIDAAIMQMEEGAIHVLTNPTDSATHNLIQLDTPIPAETWSTDSTTSLEFSEGLVDIHNKATLLHQMTQFPSPGFVLALARSLLQSMQGDLTVKMVSGEGVRSRIQCTIPHVLPEASVD